MAYQFRNLIAAAVIALTGFGANPASANSAPVVLGSFAEQVSINKTRFTLMFDSPVENLTGEDFRMSPGCTLGYLDVLDATAQVELLDCPTGFVELVLLADSVGTSPLGPAENHVSRIEIDATAPTATFSEIDIAGSGPFTYSTKLIFSEPVEFDISKLRFASDATCLNTETAIPNGWALVAVCDFAILSWALPSNTLQDNAGHQGPITQVQVAITNLRPSPPAPIELPVAPSEPPPTPNPTPAPIPIPTPTPNPEPPVFPQIPIPELLPAVPAPQSASPTVSESANSFSSETEIVDWDGELVPVIITVPKVSEPAASNLNPATLLTAPEVEEQLVVTKVPQPRNTTAAAVAVEPMAVNKTANDDPRRALWILLVGLGSVALVATGLIRRFSGR